MVHSVSFLFALVLTVILACAAIVALQARAFYRREDRWRKREEELRDQLWVLAGGKKPAVKYEHEKIVKIPDPEAPPQTPMSANDVAVFNDDVKETLEQVHPDARWLSVAQVKARWPQEWQAVERQLKAQQAPFRIS
jgi:hypothetical protein